MPCVCEVTFEFGCEVSSGEIRKLAPGRLMPCVCEVTFEFGCEVSSGEIKKTGAKCAHAVFAPSAPMQYLSEGTFATLL